MTSELHKLRIDKSQKANHQDKAVWPWVLLVVVLRAGGVGVWVWLANSAVQVVETVRVRVTETSAAGDSDLVTLNATGYIIAAHKIELASKVVGRVAWVGVEMGDKVKKDQILVRLEDDEYRARVTQQKGQLDNALARLRQLETGNRVQEIASSAAMYERAKAEAENAERTYKRLMEIRASRTTAEVDDAETMMKSRAAQAEYAKQQYEMMKAGTREEEVAAQKATVAQLEGALALATVDLNNTVIHAPLDSTILERNVEVGEFVTNGFVGDRGAKGYVLSIADLRDLLVELDISQNDFAKVTADGPCWITTDAYPDRKYDGAVERISPVANRQKATVLVRIKVLNPDDLLKPDMNATVSFLTPKKSAATQAGASKTAAAIRVPASAVHGNAVFVVEGGKAVKKVVVTGLSSAGGEVEIKKGLMGGEDLIVQSPANLAHRSWRCTRKKDSRQTTLRCCRPD